MKNEDFPPLGKLKPGRETCWPQGSFHFDSFSLRDFALGLLLPWGIVRSGYMTGTQKGQIDFLGFGRLHLEFTCQGLDQKYLETPDVSFFEGNV